MGSFNMVCGVSKAPIREDDKVRLFFIVSNTGIERSSDPAPNKVRNRLSHRGLGSSPHDHFKVLGFPMESHYTDYGTFALDESNEIVRNNIDLIKHYYVPVLHAEHLDEQYFDHFDVDKNDLNEETINNMIRDGALYVKNDYHAECFVQYFPVLEEVYQVLLQSSVSFYDRNGYNEYNLSEYMQYRHDYRKEQEVLYDAELEKQFEANQIFVGSVKPNGTVYTAEVAYAFAQGQAAIETEMYKVDTENEWTFRRSSSHKDKPYDAIDVQYETSFIMRVFTNLNIEMVPTMTASQRSEIHENAAILCKIGAVLMNRQLSEDFTCFEYNAGCKSKLTESVVEVHYDALVTYFNEHWNERITVPGKAALELYDDMFSTGTCLLSYDEANKLGLGALFFFTNTQLLSMKIVR